MIIEYHSELDVRFSTNADCGRRWKLITPFPFSVDGRRWEAPASFWTDFASIPRFIWPVVSPYEIGKGPVPHDLGYYLGVESKSYWDEVLLACMEHEKIDRWKRRPVYRAVHLFGWKAWNFYRESRKTSEQLLAKIDSRNILETTAIT